MDNCEKCKYYVQHYRLDKQQGILKVFCGHCLKRNKLGRNCKDFEKGTNDFKRVKSLNRLDCLNQIEIDLDRINKTLINLKSKIK